MNNPEKFANLVTREAANLSFFNGFSKLFPDTPEKVFMDQGHFNDTGNQMIAQNMARKLWPELANIH